MDDKPNHKGLMRILMIMTYKNYPIYVRMIGKNIFMWDVIASNQLYSSYLIMDPKKGSKVLNQKEINEVTKMCYAGAAATIDTILGIEMSDTDKQIVGQFEEARQMVDSEKEDKILK